MCPRRVSRSGAADRRTTAATDSGTGHTSTRPEYAIDAAERGHDVVVSALRSTYFSVPQGVRDDPFTYLSPAWRCPLSKAYSFDPLADMTDAAKRRVLGAECCMWSE